MAVIDKLYSWARPLLFCLEPEVSHTGILQLLHYTPSVFFAKPIANPVQVMGIEFPHTIGLAAGLDKNGEHISALAKLGFSFIEVGTVTPKAQLGNPKPRLFRIPDAAAIVNRMGFNNLGVDNLVNRVKQANYRGILGINIGKNKDTPLARAADDYLYCLEKIYALASYITINISSPNTPELRQLQTGDYFTHLIDRLHNARLQLMEQHQRRVPLVIKVAPDETDESLKFMADVMVNKGIDGIIATNTTNARKGVEGLPYANEQGGLSGRPLASCATHCLRVLKQAVGNDMALIGVGGIDSIQAAQERLDAGASLLQLYTGLIYQGPGLVHALTAPLNLKIKQG